jgi:hypothetical protein
MTTPANTRKGTSWEAAFSIVAVALLAMNLIVQLLAGPVGWLAVFAGIFAIISGTTSVLISWSKGDGLLGMLLPAAWALWGSYAIFN